MQTRNKVIFYTPMGNFPGEIIFNINGTSLSGTLKMKGQSSSFSGGKIEGSNISFSGEINVPMLRLSYTVTGTYVDGKINALAKTKMGNITIKSS